MKAIKAVALMLGGSILILAVLAVCGLGLLSWPGKTFPCSRSHTVAGSLQSG